VEAIRSQWRVKKQNSLKIPLRNLTISICILVAGILTSCFASVFVYIIDPGKCVMRHLHSMEIVQLLMLTRSFYVLSGTHDLGHIVADILCALD